MNNLILSIFLLLSCSKMDLQGMYKPAQKNNSTSWQKIINDCCAKNNFAQLIALKDKFETTDRIALTALQAAIVCEKPQAIEILIQNGARVNAKAGKGHISPIIRAIPYEGRDIKEINIEILNKLLSSGADINLVNKCKETALHLAIANKHPELATFLINKGANINAQTLNGERPILYAIKNNQGDIIELLLSKGATLHESSPKETILIAAIQNCGIGTIKLLLSYGANPNQQDISGMSPLKFVNVALERRLEIYNIISRLLLSYGANPILINKENGKNYLFKTDGSDETNQLMLESMIRNFYTSANLGNLKFILDHCKAQNISITDDILNIAMTKAISSNNITKEDITNNLVEALRKLNKPLTGDLRRLFEALIVPLD